MNIAIINCDFEDASAGALARQLFFYGRENGHAMYAFYGRGSVAGIENVYRIERFSEVAFHKGMTLLTGKQGYYSNKATQKLLKFLDAFKIEAVVLIQIHGYFINEKCLFSYLKEKRIRTIYVTSDEYACLGKCCYSNGCEKYKTECRECPQKKEYPKSLFYDRSNEIWRMKKEAYQGNHNIIFMGPRTNLDKFRTSALLKDKKLLELDWGIDVEKYKECEHDDLYGKYNIPRGKVYILTVAPYSHERKGVKKYFLEAAKKTDGQFHFINVGFDANIKSENLPSNFTAVPFIKDQKELVKFYSLSDLYVLASTQDTQPLSVLFALACGTPVCCFHVSGLRYIGSNDDTIVKYSKEVSADGLRNIIRNTKKKDADVSDKCREYAIDRYSNTSFNKKVFRSICEGWNI